VRADSVILLSERGCKKEGGMRESSAASSSVEEAYENTLSELEDAPFLERRSRAREDFFFKLDAVFSRELDEDLKKLATR
jgi:hypothetical protein